MYWSEINLILEELKQIKEENLMIQKAIEGFLNKSIPSKVLRELYKSLSNNGKVIFLNELYNEGVYKENMQRLPPSILVQNPETINSNDEKKVLEILLGYVLLEEYDKSTKTNKIDKLKKVINRCENNQQMYFRNDNSLISEVRSKAINFFINNLVKRNNIGEIEPLGLPKSMTFGVEIEFVKISSYELKKIVSFLKKYDIKFLNGFHIKYDPSVKEHANNYYKRGTEVTSPVLQDCKEDWKRLQDAMSFIRCLGGVTNSNCGGHIHIGANILGYDANAWQTCSEVYSEIEPLFFTISNRRGEQVRKGAYEYAKEISNNVESVNWSSVDIKNDEDLKNLARQINRDKLVVNRQIRRQTCITRRNADFLGLKV